MKIYLCGPEVFLPNATEVLSRKAQICSALGWEGLSPLDNEIPPLTGTPRKRAQAIYQANLDMMRRADAAIANITPFRGPHMDPGTAFEIGFMVSQNKPVMLYTQHSKPLVDRVQEWSGELSRVNGALRDRNGHAVENFGLLENLMIESGAFSATKENQTLVVPTTFERAFVCETGFVAAAFRLRELLEEKRPAEKQVASE